jgi:hypothetical protein
LPSYLAREDPQERIIEPQELIKHLKDPTSVSPGSSMPSFAAMPSGQLKLLATFLANKK